MIRKSVQRFFEKHALGLDLRDHAQSKAGTMNRTAAMGGALVAICVVLAAAGWRERPHLELWLAMQGAGASPEQPLIAILGDSLVEGVNWRLLLHCDGIGNYGASGDTTTQVLARLPRILELKPKLLMVMAGTNDALLGIAPAETLANLRAIEAQTTMNGTAFVSFSPPPLPLKADALAPVRAAASLSIPFDESDLRKDRVHLKTSGYAKWRDAAMPTVLKYCASRTG
jgi:lysophospholipase L1-like esterase